jgi:hypothetical protein
MKVERTILTLKGKVSPPADMIAAARASLSEVAFTALMEKTKGFPPTADELCAVLMAERQAKHPNLNS